MLNKAAFIESVKLYSLDILQFKVTVSYFNIFKK